MYSLINCAALAVFLTIAATQAVDAQDDKAVEDLQEEVAKLPDDTTKVNMLHDLARTYAMGAHMDEAMDAARKSLALARAIHFSKGEIAAVIAISNIYGLEGNYPESYKYLEEGLAVSRETSDTRHEAIIMNNMAIALQRKGDFAGSIRYAESSLEIYKAMGDKYMMGTPLQILGAAYERQGKFAEAIAFLSRARKVWEEVDHKSGVANVLSSLGVLNINMGNFGEALAYHKQYVQIHKSLDNRHHLVEGYLDVAKVFTAMNALDSALLYCQRARTLQDQLEITYATGYILHDMGVIYQKMGESDKAIDHFKKALAFNEHAEDVEEIIGNWNSLAEAYLEKGAYEDAIASANKSLAITTTSGDRIKVMQSSYRVLARSYAALHKYEEAYRHHALYDQYKDSLFTETNARRIAEMNSKFEVEKKEQEIQAMARENELATLRRNVLITSISVLAVAGFVFYYQQRLRARRNRMLFEKEKALDRVKSRFFANISHEFRTPLTLILGPLEEIKQKITDRKLQVYLELMQKNAGKLLNQINQLLDLSKLESGGVKSRVTRGDIVSIIRGIAMSFESLAEIRQTDLSFSSDKEVITGYFDRDAVEKIVVNLLSNAFKFTGGGEAISVRIAGPSPDKVTIAVCDTGRGMRDDALKNIFERYYYAESDLQASTGIGLALVKELVENHKGSIAVASKEGEGSTFTVTLPVGRSTWREEDIVEQDGGYGAAANGVRSVMDIARPPAEKEMEEWPGDGKETILVIEDNADVRLFIRSILQEEYQVMEAESGRRGIELAEEHVPDLVITDIMMPEMDGYEVARSLKQNEITSHIPVIMLTAKADPESRLEGLASEADDFLTKPFERTELTARIANLINMRKKLRERFAGAGRPGMQESTVKSIDDVFLEKVMIIIEENIDNTAFGVEDLGRAVGLSRSQIHRKLQALTGEPPNRLIRNRRLARAIELLKSNAGTVAEIAYMTGFSTPNYFSKCFSEHFGFAPGEVRKQQVV